LLGQNAWYRKIDAETWYGLIHLVPGFDIGFGSFVWCPAEVVVIIALDGIKQRV
jgi:hypothetical protein